MFDNEKNIEFWDRIAQQTAPNRGAHAGMLMQGRDFEAIDRCRGEESRFLEISPPLHGARVLEVGCGGGRWAAFLSPRVEFYLGIDISPRMIELSRHTGSELGLRNAQFQCRDLRKLEAPQFDLIYFSGVLQYMSDEDVRTTLLAATRLLNTEGVFISRDSVQTNARVELTGDYPVIYRKEGEYRRFFAELGFEPTYSGLSYEHRRFTKIAGRVFKLTDSYMVASTARRFLCAIDSCLGEPWFLKPADLRDELRRDDRREHRFFKYERGAPGEPI